MEEERKKGKRGLLVGRGWESTVFVIMIFFTLGNNGQHIYPLPVVTLEPLHVLIWFDLVWFSVGCFPSVAAESNKETSKRLRVVHA